VTAFEDYAEYYDLFYADKDYAAESAFVRGIIQRYAPQAKSILELGCGTARHAMELVKDGFSITGVDLSAQMLARAREKIGHLPPNLRNRIKLTPGDVSNFAAVEQYDAAISLFHVMSYQITNESLNGIFQSARKALGDDGVFVFDFWYGPAVLALKPASRERTIDTVDRSITRIAEPDHHPERNVVDVNLTFVVSDRNDSAKHEVREKHPMRYLFIPEIEQAAAAHGFTIVESGEWLTGNPLHDGAWSGYAAVRPLKA
jgi:SAM-dependent methyltransferase